MGPTDIILPLVAALWALGSLIHNVVQELNEKRDRILTGRHGDIRLSDAHRRLYLENDWIPLNFLVILASYGFGSIAILLPMLLTEEDRSFTAWCVCSVVALFSMACGSVMLGCMFIERRIICKYLNERAYSDLERNLRETSAGRRVDRVKPIGMRSRPHGMARGRPGSQPLNPGRRRLEATANLQKGRGRGASPGTVEARLPIAH